MEQAAVLGDGRRITPAHLPGGTRQEFARCRSRAGSGRTAGSLEENGGISPGSGLCGRQPDQSRADSRHQQFRSGASSAVTDCCSLREGGAGRPWRGSGTASAPASRSRRRTGKKTRKRPASLDRLMMPMDQGVAKPGNSRKTRAVQEARPAGLKSRMRWEKACA